MGKLAEGGRKKEGLACGEGEKKRGIGWGKEKNNEGGIGMGEREKERRIGLVEREEKEREVAWGRDYWVGKKKTAKKRDRERSNGGGMPLPRKFPVGLHLLHIKLFNIHNQTNSGE